NGTTLCMVTHDPRYADMAKQKLHLLDGRILDTAREAQLHAVGG
ncbi:putative ABC transport system ATP-binding protein, partial [Alkalimonas amylolytica]